MLRGIEADEPVALAAPHLEASGVEAVVAQAARAEYDADLPSGRPQWVKDGLAVSRAARQLAARLRPIVIRVFTFWDHRVRSAVVAGRRLQIDASGSYSASL